jgi:hypothetical protein
MLLGPAEFAIELAIGDMQEAELRQDRAIRLGKWKRSVWASGS